MASTTGPITELNERLLGIPKSTQTHLIQQMRGDASLFQRGKRGNGASAVAPHELANLLISFGASTSLGMRRSPGTIDLVKRARAAKRLNDPDIDRHCTPGFLSGLTIDGAKTFGEALDGLIGDMQAGTFAAWKANDSHTLVIRFFDGAARVVINVSKSYRDAASRAAVIVFRDESGAPVTRGPCLSASAEMNGFAIEALAAEIGGPMPD